MRSHARFAKTEKGQEEIRNRTYRLQPKPRALLVIVDGKKAADELLQTATGLGGGPELLESLIKDGFIEEVSAEAPAAGKAAPATDKAAPAVDKAAPAADSAIEVSREKVYAAKAAMRRYIKMAAVEVRLLSKLVDDVQAPEDVVRVLGELRQRFEANGFGDAYANLRKELSG
jgi:hypothetical protein